MFLSEEFLGKYPNRPDSMTDLGEFVFYRTYSRWLDDLRRRETWKETTLRASNYNVELEYWYRVENGLPIDMNRLKTEAEKLFETQFNLRGFLSGRTNWIGGTPVAYKFPLANFNCAFEVIKRFEDFTELFYLLMIGCGVGFRSLPADVEQIEGYRLDVTTRHRQYRMFTLGNQETVDFTSLIIENNDKAIIKVGDSKEGWVKALSLFFELHTSYLYRSIKEIEIDYDYVRPKGERLKTFGGTASGYESLRNMFMKIDRIMKSSNEARTIVGENKAKLTTIGVLDIANIIGENVVVGGVRRTSEIGLGDISDSQFITAKNGIFKQDEDGNWVVNEAIRHREMSNNSVIFNKKPTREQLHDIIQSIKISGEPGFYNLELANKRTKVIASQQGLKFTKRQGTNPCGEIVLDDKQTCNLTTNNVLAYVKNGKLDREAMFEGFRVTAKAGFRMTLVDLEIPSWSIPQKRDRLTGVSITGWQDMVEAVNLTLDEQRNLLKELRKVVRDAVNELADELGLNRPLLTTTVKPEGTLSKLPTVSEGLHFSHSPYYIRRIRINKSDALYKMALELGWDIEDVNETTAAILFPVKSQVKRTKSQVSALEQLEIYKMFMAEYVEHNASITVHVRDNEWGDVEQWLWDNWDEAVVGLTFIGLDDNVYPHMPYESIDEDEYLRRISEMKKFDAQLLNKYENGMDKELENDCTTGVCPTR